MTKIIDPRLKGVSRNMTDIGEDSLLSKKELELVSGSSSWTVVEKYAQGTDGVLLTSGDWRIIPFTDTVGVNNINGSSLNANVFTFEAGYYEFHLHVNFRPEGQPIFSWGALRFWNVTDGTLIERLPNINPSAAIDYYANGHENGNGISVVVPLTLDDTKDVQFECFPNVDFRTGKPINNAAVGEEYYSRLFVKRF